MVNSLKWKFIKFDFCSKTKPENFNLHAYFIFNNLRSTHFNERT